MSRMSRHAIVILALAAGSANAQVLIDDFTTFNSGTWTAAPYVNGNQGYAYLGLPQTLVPITLDGNNMVRMTSVISNNFQRRGFGSIQGFSAPAGSLALDFKIMPFQDASVPSANQFNIDVNTELKLINPADGRYFSMGVSGSNFGNPANRLISFDSSFGGGTAPAIGWNYDTYYRFTMNSDGTTTRLSFRTATDLEILGQTFNFGFDDLGSYRIFVGQLMGTPNAEYYTDSALDRLVFTGVPEPGSLALCGLAVAGLISYSQRRHKSRQA